MIRYKGERISKGARLAVISNDALGNFVVVTPLLQMLRQQNASVSIDYYGGVRTWELQSQSDLVDFSFPLRGSAPSEQAAIAAERRGYDLVINVERVAEAKIFAGRIATESTFVCGPCSDMPGSDLPFAVDGRGDLWRDSAWIAEDITKRYPFLKSGFVGEILCRLAYLEGPIPPYKVPSEDPLCPIPPILISTAATLEEKIWPVENWRQIIKFFQVAGLKVGLLGAHPIRQKLFWQGSEEEDEIVASGLVEDLRGKLTLPQVVGALHKAKLVLTLDNGILHLAAAARKRTVGIFRFGIHRLWAPPVECLTVITPSAGGKVSDISVDTVRDAVSRAL